MKIAKPTEHYEVSASALGEAFAVGDSVEQAAFLEEMDEAIYAMGREGWDLQCKAISEKITERQRMSVIVRLQVLTEAIAKPLKK